MGIDKQSDVAADLQIGPTTSGMVRIYIEGGGVELPLDFEPEEAEEIAAELIAAATAARSIASGATGSAKAAGTRSGGGKPGKPGKSSRGK